MICMALRNMSGSLLMNCWRSTSLSIISLSVSDIALLHKLTRLMLVNTGMFSCIIWVGEGGGGVETKSMYLTIGGFVSFTFIALAFLISSLTNHLNCS